MKIVHASSSQFLETHFIIVLPSTPGSSMWSFFLEVFPPKPCIQLKETAVWV
jgi:hypothetical protein